MDVLTRLIICGLAAYRLTEMIVLDYGPFDAFLEMRGWFMAAKKHEPIRRMIGNGLGCVYCVGAWSSFLMAILFYSQNILLDFIVIFFAIAGLQSLLATKAGRQ